MRNIDSFLMRKYPNLWITNAHHAIFYVLVIDFILWSLASLFRFDIEESIPDVEGLIAIFIIPSIIFLVVWFVKQARYNVDKNYGKSHLGHDLLNFFTYIFVITLFYSVAAVVPHTFQNQVGSSISKEELRKDVDNLNNAYVYFDPYGNNVSQLNGDLVVDNNHNYVHLYYRDDEVYDYTEEIPDEVWEPNRQISRKEALREIEKFVLTYNKYTKEDILDSPERILENAIAGRGTHLDYSGWREQVDYKIERIHRVQMGKASFMLSDSDYLKVIFAIIGMLALLTWMFKNVHWKNSLATIITVALFPVLIGIIALIMFEIFRSGRDGEHFGMFLVVLTNLIAIGFCIKAWAGKVYSSFGIVCAMLAQIWAPFMIFVYSMFYISMYRYRYDYYYGWNYWADYIENTYWLGWGMAIVSIIILKPFYKKMWAMPRAK